MTIIAITDDYQSVSFDSSLTDQQCIDICDQNYWSYSIMIDSEESFVSDGKDQETYDLYVVAEQNFANIINQDDDSSYQDAIRYI